MRRGAVWVAMNMTGILLERRPPRGLLGGTLAFPTSGWDGTDVPAPFPASWRETGEVRHVFTHFDLRLTVLRTGPEGEEREIPMEDAE